MAADCGVCLSAESKYKCPACTLPYCSLACYKSHKTTHSTTEPSQPRDDTRDPIPTVPVTLATKTDIPAAQHSTPPTPRTGRQPSKFNFQGLDNDPAMLELLQRDPMLRLKLQSIYGLTLEPGESGSWTQVRGDGEAAERLGRMRSEGGEWSSVNEFVRLVGARLEAVKESGPG